MRRCLSIILFIFLFSFNHVLSNNASLYTIRGSVMSEGAVVPYVTVYIDELHLYTMSDVNGYFELKNIPSGIFLLETKCMGYVGAKKYIDIKDSDATVEMSIKVSSYELNEVQVMATRAKQNRLEIGESAIEYVQPVSLADLFVLLPGNVYQENSMTGFSLNTNRQVGADQNTSLGIAVMADGIPQGSDGSRTQMVGVTANSYGSSGDSQVKERSAINAGTDMRYISTDHIKSVNVTKGISSAKFGNLSNGQIQINSKQGVSPLKLRGKVDLKNKLIYAGKGFALGDKLGTLYVGADFLHSVDDIREEMEKFSRFTAQAYYNNKFAVGTEYALDLDMKLSQTISINKMKKDELTYEYNESYLADYSKSDLMVKGKLNLGERWIDNITLNASLSRTDDLIDRHYCVITATPRSMPLAYSEGESEGYYLPTMYYSDFYIENIPIAYYAQLNINSRMDFSSNLFINVDYGLDFTATKNRGDGAVIKNEKQPPFPNDNSYMRPRRNYEIPAIEIGGAFVQSNLTVKPDKKHSVSFDMGVRFTKMYNLPTDYALSNKTLVEPRLNMKYTITSGVKHNFRLGYGEENKLPTMDYLYPEKIYKDFWMLNAYTTNPNNRHLITYTKIFEAVNKDIRENKNQKVEFGYDMDIDRFSLSMTLFSEKSSTGFEYFKFYEPVSYKLYQYLKEDADISGRRPEKTDYIEQDYSEFTSYTRVMNSKKTIKRGVEYRVTFPKVRALQTEIEINGAYYMTRYGSSLPDYFYPNSKVGDERFPYVGIYDLDATTEMQRFNSNFWFNTHIPQFKLIFTNFFQLIWTQSSQYTDNFDGIYKKVPYAYIDFQGVTHNVTPEQLEKINGNEDVYWYQLRRQSTVISYQKETKPVYLLWNIKATKEIGRVAKLSFFVNGILDVHPKYMSNTSARTKREWSNPYFGMELILSFSNL